MTGIDLERLVCKAVNGGCADLELMRQALGVRLLPSPGPRSWLRDRLRLAASAVLTTLRFARADFPPLSSAAVAFTPGANRESLVEARRFFLQHHFGVECDFLGREARRGARSPRSRAWLVWWLRGVAWSALAFFDWSDKRYAWLGGSLVDMQAFKRLEGELEHVYVFALYDRRQYLVMTFLARHTSLAVTAVYQSMPLARNCRHLHVPVDVVLTSRVNLHEAEHYRGAGLFLPASIAYASQEFIVDTYDLAPGERLWDIGYYSSGEWARYGGLYQCQDVEQLRRGAFLDNPYARAAAEQIEALATYARVNQRSLRVYLHPLERRLLNDHGLAPPYAHLADGQLITLDATEGHSRRTLYDARVAVSLQSSFIWERLDAGEEASFIHEFEDPAMNVFERAALGPYAANVYRSVDELLARVDAALQER